MFDAMLNLPFHLPLPFLSRALSSALSPIRTKEAWEDQKSMRGALSGLLVLNVHASAASLQFLDPRDLLNSHWRIFNDDSWILLCMADFLQDGSKYR
jgi:hypothetical protein